MSENSSRLPPQLEVKIPTLRQWGKKLAVAVDAPFFEAIGGITSQPSRDLNEGDIIWHVVRVSDDYQLQRNHWEILRLEASARILLAADTITRGFENVLRNKLHRLD